MDKDILTTECACNSRSVDINSEKETQIDGYADKILSHECGKCCCGQKFESAEDVELEFESEKHRSPNEIAEDGRESREFYEEFASDFEGLDDVNGYGGDIADEAAADALEAAEGDYDRSGGDNGIEHMAEYVMIPYPFGINGDTGIGNPMNP